ncbi:uncharacterized protein LOC127838508 [Dreissena polymorpha]|uniref:CUB domain-containing protein n=1 Tax=Dreissena polymorpha TaxID=45954 RepID=A0A9D4FRR0_DREPO|nr:uncharacterized protein LOC127838508 [Dreissena polymorpha]KAH3803026.1 hypothetical protein DPMN_156724 [Dreissena polymorpha]
MMQRISLFVVVACAVMGTVAGQNCTPETTFTEPFNAWQIDKFPALGANCTWRLNVTNTTQNTLQFSGLNLNPTLVHLLVTTENDTVIANLTDSNGIEVVISLSNFTKVVLQRTAIAGTVTGNISANYDTSACSFTMTGSRGLIKSPLYGNQLNRTFTCSVAVTKPQDTDLFVLTFTGFSVSNGSLLVTLGSDTPRTLSGATLPDDILGTSTQDSFNLSLNINTNVIGQNFTLLYQTADSDCSGAKTAATAAAIQVLPAATQFPIQCYIQLRASTGNQVFTELQLSGGEALLGALDSLIVYDGLSRRSPMLGTLNSAFKQFVSTSVGMTIVGELGMQARLANISYRADPVSKVVTVTKGVVQNVSLTANMTATQAALLQFNGDGAMLRITVTGTLANSASVVTIKNSQERLVFSFRSGMALFPVTVSDKTARVSAMLNGTDTVNIEVAAVDADCNMVYTDITGQVTVTTAVDTRTSCSIAFVPDQSLMTQLSLRVNLCATGNLTVYDGFETGAKTLATITENTAVTQIWGPTGLRLVYSQPANCTNQIVSASYQSLAANSACGNLSQTGQLTTPNNPNQYPLNANCNWALPARNTSWMYITVNAPVQLQNTHSVTLLQNLTKSLAMFNASTTNPIPDIVVQNVNLSVAFNSAPAGSGLDMSGSGANITVRVIDCGATLNMNATGIFGNSGANQTMECIWVIQVAAGNSTNPNIISANLSMTSNPTADNTLTVKDGSSGRNDDYLPKLNRTILSRTNYLWVRYSYTAKLNTKPLNFTLSYSTYVCLNVCKNSLCMHPDWQCNGKNDCGDWSDELNCTIIPTPPPTPPPAPHTDDTKKSSAGWYVFCILVGLLLGVMLTVLVPRCVRHVRGRPSSSSRSGYSNMAEDA